MQQTNNTVLFSFKNLMFLHQNIRIIFSLTILWIMARFKSNLEKIFHFLVERHQEYLFIYTILYETYWKTV